MNTCVPIVVFWGSVAALFFTYLGYPLLMGLLARRTGARGESQDPQVWPFVSVVLVARNEEVCVGDRTRNLAASEYPADRIEFVVVSDGSTDDTASEIEKVGEPRARVIEQPSARGKAAGLNTGVSAARGEIVVFADARQTFHGGTIRALVRELSNSQFGAVSGELVIAESGGGVAAGIDAYWRLERFLRRSEAQVDSCIGCTGAVYAIKREFFDPLPEDTILDDVVIPMRIAVSGKRVGFCAEATAFDPQRLDPASENRRKRRTLAGNFQMLFRYPDWLLPWRNRLCWQLIAHKYLRLIAPIFLLAAAVANAALLHVRFYQVIGVMHLAFYVLAAFGLRWKARLFSIPAGFVFLNYNVLRGLADYLAGSKHAGWDKAKAGGQPAA